MTTDPYHRAVLRVLRDDYGVRAQVQRAHGHPYLRFDYGDRSHRVTLSGTPSDPDALRLKVQDIRRQLGPPKHTEKTVRRRLEEMMPELSTRPLSTLTGAAAELARGLSVENVQRSTGMHATARVAVYRRGARGGRVKVMVPPGVASSFPGGATVVRLDDETWEVRGTSGPIPRFRREGEYMALMSNMDGEHIPFGISPADVVEVDGKLVVHCPIATRAALAGRHVAPAPRIIETIDAPTTESPPVLGYAPTHPDKASMLRVLRDIAVIEGTEWRLAKVNGAWEFRIPSVRLEDS